jgi:hypothetical protein
MLNTADLKMLAKETLPDGWYIAEFDFPGSPGNVERIVIEAREGLCYTTGDSEYADGPLPIEETGYRIVEKIGLWSGPGNHSPRAVP